MKKGSGGRGHVHPLQREKLIHEKRIQSLNFFFFSLFHTIKCTKRQTESEAEAEGAGGWVSGCSVVSQLQLPLAVVVVAVADY